MKIAVIGAGKMGVWFARFFIKQGYSVVLASRNKAKLSKLGINLGIETTGLIEAVQKADKILICVSIGAFEEVVKRIGPIIREDQVVMDICSIKDFPVQVMHTHIKSGLVLGTHPVFGPGSKGVKNKTFVLTPISDKEKEYAKTLKEWLQEKEARVFIMPPKKHDQLMSVVLGLPHFIGLVAGDTLLAQPDFAKSKSVAGTTYRMLFTLAEATMLENPELCSSLQLNLPEIQKIENLFVEKAREWLTVIQRKDSSAIIKKMELLRKKLADKSPDYAQSYEMMYKMLEASDN